MELKDIETVTGLAQELNKILENQKILPIIIGALETGTSTESVVIRHTPKYAPMLGAVEVLKTADPSNSIFLTGNTKSILIEFLKQVGVRYDEEKERLEKKLADL